MDGQADAVAEAVAEVLAVARRVDHVARDRVHGGAVGAGADGVQRGQLRLQAQLVGGGQLGRQLALGGERPRAVRAVAVEHAADVDRDERAGLDHARRAARRAAARRAVPEATIESNDGPSRPASWNSSSTLPRDLALGAPDQPLRGERVVDALEHGRRPAHRSDLVRILDRAQRLDHAGLRRQLDAGQRVRQPAVALDGQAGLLEPERPAVRQRSPPPRPARPACRARRAARP